MFQIRAHCAPDCSIALRFRSRLNKSLGIKSCFSTSARLRTETLRFWALDTIPLIASGHRGRWSYVASVRKSESGRFTLRKVCTGVHLNALGSPEMTTCSRNTTWMLPQFLQFLRGGVGLADMIGTKRSTLMPNHCIKLAPSSRPTAKSLRALPSAYPNR